MNALIENAAVAAIVLGAAAYLFSRAFRSSRRGTKPCGSGCGCDTAKKA